MAEVGTESIAGEAPPPLDGQSRARHIGRSGSRVYSVWEISWRTGKILSRLTRRRRALPTV